jgi:RNA polymerase sigma-70 factor (ECF subfamily)
MSPEVGGEYLSRHVMMTLRRGATLSQTQDERDDAKLVQDYARGDAAALDELVRRVFPRAYGFALRSLGDPGLAEDAAAEACVALMKSARRFDPARPFGPWWGSLLVHTVEKARRSRIRRLRRETRAAEARPTTTEAAGERRIEGEELAEKVAELPADVRSALVLHYFEGRTHEEIAAITGCPAGTAASRIRRGLERLRDALGAGAASVVTFEALDVRLREAAKEPVHVPATPTARALAARARLLPGALVAVAAPLVLALGVALALERDRVASALGLASADALAPATPVATSSPPSVVRHDSSTVASPPTAPVAVAPSVPPSVIAPAPPSALPAARATVHLDRVLARLVDAQGRGIGGLELVLERRGPEREGATILFHEAAESDQEGRLELHPTEATPPREPIPEGVQTVITPAAGLTLEPADDLALVARVARFERKIEKAASLVKNGTIDLGTIQVPKTYGIFTVLVRSGATFVEGAQIMVWALDAPEGANLFWIPTSDGAGRAERPLVHEPRKLRIVVRKDGFAEEQRIFEWKGTDDRTTIDLEPEGVVSGSIVDPDGKALVDEYVNVRDAEDKENLHGGHTDKDGHFEIHTLRSGTSYTLEIGPRSGYLRTTRLVQAPAADVDFTLRRGGQIELALVRPDGLSVGKGFYPVASDFQLVSADAPRSLERAIAYDMRGTEAVSIGSIPPGRYRVVGAVQGVAPFATAPVTIEATEKVELSVTLDVGRSLSGRVVDPSGAPARGASVTYLVGGNRKLETSTGDDGRFTFRFLPREDVALTAKGKDGAAASVTALASTTELADIVLVK